MVTRKIVNPLAETGKSFWSSDLVRDMFREKNWILKLMIYKIFAINTSAYFSSDFIFSPLFSNKKEDIYLTIIKEKLISHADLL